MPMKISSNGYKIFSELSLKTYEKYLDIEKLKAFYIITPKKDIKTIKTLVQSSFIPFEFISDETLIYKDIEDWYKQQILKLTIAYLIETEYYLIVDSDIYLTQNLSYNDLFYKGKVKYHSETWKNKNYSKWWINSCRVLNVQENKIIRKKDLMSFVPQIMCTNIVKELLSSIDILTIEKEKFTEFTIYWLYILKNNYKDLYTNQGFPLWNSSSNHNILDISNGDPYNITRSFINPLSYFSAIQGYLNIDTDVYIKEGLKCIRRKQIDAIFISSSVLNSNENYIKTIESVRSVRQKINAICILIEGSKLSIEHKQGFHINYDYVLEYYDKVDKYFNNSNDMCYIEFKLLQVGIDYIKRYILPYYEPKYIFNLRSKCKLDDNFNLENYNKDKFTFYEYYNSSVQSYVYATGLYNIPIKYIDIFIELIKNIKDCDMIEKIYHNILHKDICSIIPTLCLENYNNIFSENDNNLSVYQ